MLEAVSCFLYILDFSVYSRCLLRLLKKKKKRDLAFFSFLICSYCECFAAGVYCVEPCSCLDCFNKPVHEDTVLATRKQIESRNPLAFAPKVISPVLDIGVGKVTLNYYH